MENDVVKLLESVYYNPSSEGSFGGVKRLFQEVQKLEKSIKLQQVKDFLKAQDAYTYHRDITRKFKRQATIVQGIDSQWQADLVVMPELAIYNDEFVYLLTVIDVFSKYAWAIPLKTKTGESLIRAFQLIFDSSNRKPEKLQTDKGTEFINSKFQNFLKRNNIHFFTTESELKASICERFNRTLKSRMWRYLSYKNTKRYIDVLDDLVTAYNNSKHSTIGIAPRSVNASNEDVIRKRIYGNTVKTNKSSKPKFFVNETVRLNTLKGAFEKGYTGNWTEEIFKIDKIYTQYLPFMYRIKDSTGNIVKGRFYENELQSVIISADKEYKIERIEKKRKRKGKTEVFIKWMGYPESANTWEPEDSIKHLL